MEELESGNNAMDEDIMIVKLEIKEKKRMFDFDCMLYDSRRGACKRRK